MIEQAKLPYALDALSPIINAQTMDFHYNKHHAAYVKNTNDLIKGTAYESLPLEELIMTVSDNKESQKIYNNAAQTWNHTFFWNSMTDKDEYKKIPSLIEDKLIQDFGSVEDFKKQFTDIAVSQFGSGWTWLVFEGGQFKIVKTGNADTPLTNPAQDPMLCVDVWEHAYYLDYQNRRADFVRSVLDLVNWDFVRRNFEGK